MDNTTTKIVAPRADHTATVTVSVAVAVERKRTYASEKKGGERSTCSKDHTHGTYSGNDINSINMTSRMTWTWTA
jgi:hypothetical protein